jgi:DNA-binding LacI/PurR family transcriptional regulator
VTTLRLKDIAEQANVSVSTVSRIINSPNGSFATPEVRDRVWRVIRETGYTPNPIARQLRKGESEKKQEPSKTIACVFGRARAPADNPFFAEVVRAIEQQALKKGYVVVSVYSLLDTKGASLLEKVSSVRADGAIVVGRFDERMRDFFNRTYKYLVYTGLNAMSSDWDQVISDGYAAAETAIRHLHSLGHRRIGYIGETDEEVRFDSYRNTLASLGIAYDPTLVCSCPLEKKGGFEGASRMLEKVERMPTAIFCANDITAIAVMQRLLQAGLKVPRDISVMGIDDIDIAQYMNPMLTTVDIPKMELGRNAVRLLIDRIENGKTIPMTIKLPYRLVVRESVASPKRTRNTTKKGPSSQ